MSVTVRPFCGADEAALIRLWNASMTHDPINAAVLRTRVLLDPNFTPANLLVADDAGELVGFVLGLMRRVSVPGLLRCAGHDARLSRRLSQSCGIDGAARLMGAASSVSACAAAPGMMEVCVA